MFLKRWVFVIIGLLLSAGIFAQEESIDNSKPTNFYTFLDNSLENTFNKDGSNVFGYRAQITYAPSGAHLLLGELPLLYNDQTKVFGVGDLRARYFYLPYKNYERFFGSLGPSIDVFIPVTNADDGLGTGSYVIAPGVMGGLMFADWIQAFPIVSYQYITKSNSSSLPDSINKVRHGLTFQAIIPVVFSDKFFIQITPILQMNDLGDERSDAYVQEFLAVYGITQKLQVTTFWRGNFTNSIHMVRLGMTVFL